MVGLMLLLLFWGQIDQHFIKPTFFPDHGTPTEVEQTPAEAPTQPMPADTDAVPQLLPPETEEEVIAPIDTSDAAPTLVEDISPVEPGEVRILDLERIVVEFNSLGGAIGRITLNDFAEENQSDSPPIVLDFESAPALALRGIAELTPSYPFEISELPDGMGVRFSRETSLGLQFQREIRVQDDYLFHVRDTFINLNSQALSLPAFRIHTGRMEPVPGGTSAYGTFPISIDTLMPGGNVKRWGRDINNRWFRNSPPGLFERSLETPVDWVAVKNRFFVQSLRPRTTDSQDTWMFAEIGEDREMQSLRAALQFPAQNLAPNATVEREFFLYVGPQNIARLTALGHHQNLIMELGWRPIRFFAGLMMIGLTAIYGVFGNYGVAIMLLTVIVRVAFWPLTHKGTESMRRMQEIGPLMKELNEKYKDDAQKRQQAMMQLYKEHKVNPLGGCLPMIVQIPVFIGLFYLLRSAVELRHASFLWISDLSEPERLIEFGFTIPLVGWSSLNLLPIFMAGTMFLQQKLTPMPSSGDEKQQQVHATMMKVMPVMMLVLLYDFAAGLALYWSTQNVLMIIQQALYRRRKARQEAQAGAVKK